MSLKSHQGYCGGWAGQQRRTWGWRKRSEEESRVVGSLLFEGEKGWGERTNEVLKNVIRTPKIVRLFFLVFAYQRLCYWSSDCPERPSPKLISHVFCRVQGKERKAAWSDVTVSVLTESAFKIRYFSNMHGWFGLILCGFVALVVFSFSILFVLPWKTLNQGGRDRFILA